MGKYARSAPAPRPPKDDQCSVQELIRYATGRRHAGGSIDKRTAVILLDAAVDGAMLSYVEAWKRHRDKDDKTNFQVLEDERSTRISWVCDTIRADKATRDAIHKIKRHRNEYVHRLSGSIPSDELLDQAQETAHNVFEKIFGKPPDLGAPSASSAQVALRLLLEIETLLRELQPLVDLAACHDGALAPEQVYEGFNEVASLNQQKCDDAKLRLKELFEYRRKALEVGILSAAPDDVEKLERDLDIIRALTVRKELTIPLRARILQALLASGDVARYWGKEVKTLGKRLKHASLIRKRFPLLGSDLTTFDELHYQRNVSPDLYTDRRENWEQWCLQVVWDDRSYIWDIEDVEKWWDILPDVSLSDIRNEDFEDFFFGPELAAAEVVRRLTQRGVLESVAVRLDIDVFQQADTLSMDAEVVRQIFVGLGGDAATGRERIKKYDEAYMESIRRDTEIMSGVLERRSGEDLEKLNRMLFLDVLKPDGIPGRVMGDILRLVSDCGEVNPDNLERKLADCQAIATLKRGDQILATCALKALRSTRNDAVSRWSEYRLGPDWSEFGYAAVASPERGAGKGKMICDALLMEWQDSSLYATVRRDNGAMRRILETNRFREVGMPWKSQRRESELLSLWVRVRAAAAG